MSLLVVAAVVAAAPPAAERPTVTNAIKARHEVCYMLATSGAYPAFDIADCLSFAAAPSALFYAQVCSFLRDTDQLGEYDFRSYADCIQRGVIR